MGRSTETRVDAPSRGTAPPAEPNPDTPAAGLRKIQVCLHRWVERIERQLDEIRDAPPATPDELLLEVSEQRRALQAERQQRDREWAERLQALEHDRRQIAEAWERLEACQAAQPAQRRATAAAAAPEPAPDCAGDPSSGETSAVDRAILRQFEALRRDVRRKAEIHQTP